MVLDGLIKIKLNEDDLKEAVKQYLKTKKINVDKNSIVFSKGDEYRVFGLYPPIGEEDFVRIPGFICTAMGTKSEEI